MRKWTGIALRNGLIFLIVFGHRLSYGQPAAGIEPLTNPVALGGVSLQTLEGKNFPLSDLHKKLFALVFLSPECPLCQNYALVLNHLDSRFGNDLDIVGIFPGKAYSVADCRTFRKKYHILFPLMLDTPKHAVKALGATITPEVFLFDQSGNLIYRGAIDNWVTALGRQRTKATENYLEEGIRDRLAGVEVKTKSVKAIGCFINDY